MRVSLNLSLELNLPFEELSPQKLRGFVRQALRDNVGLCGLAKDFQVGPAKPVYKDLHDRVVAAGKARAASMSAERRSQIARRAALARWSKE